eukprot:scaffold5160_cov66-Cyclotella_meneghiniana.AAC.1
MGDIPTAATKAAPRASLWKRIMVKMKMMNIQMDGDGGRWQVERRREAIGVGAVSSYLTLFLLRH